MEQMMSKTTTHVISAKSEVLDARELSPQELACSAERDLRGRFPRFLVEAVSGGDVYVELFGHKVTSSDVASAAKWVWNKLF
jgi:hypothetical protein